MATFSTRDAKAEGPTAATPLEGLSRTIDQAYQELIGKGRQNEAFALREAQRRFTNAAGSSGINSFARSRALAGLQAQMSTARTLVESQVLAEGLRQQASLASQISSLTQRDKEFLANQEGQLRREEENTRQFDVGAEQRATEARTAKFQDRKRLELARKQQLRSFVPKPTSPTKRLNVNSGASATGPSRNDVITARANIGEAKNKFFGDRDPYGVGATRRFRPNSRDAALARLVL